MALMLKSAFMSSEAERRSRAERRRAMATIHRGKLGQPEVDFSPVRGDAAITLVTRLTRESWSLAGRGLPTYSRGAVPCRFVPGRLT
jgi:hypothetical protein